MPVHPPISSQRRRSVRPGRVVLVTGLAGLLAGLLAAGPAAGPALAGGGSTGPVNRVVVQSDHGTELKGKAALAVFGGSEFRAGNLAYARSFSCTACHTRAVAVQEVVLTSTPTTYAPENVAVALNESCTGCTTVAYARQVVVQAGPGARLDHQGEEAAKALLRDIERTAKDPRVNDVPYGLDEQGKPHSELTDRLDGLVAQLDQTVRASLARTGSRGDQVRDDRREDDVRGDD